MNDAKTLLTGLLEYAAQHGADLHICPKSAPFVRLGGVNGEIKSTPCTSDSPLDVADVKALVGELLTPEQKGELQKTKFIDFSFTYGKLGRFRACVYFQRGTQAINIHPLPFEVPDIHKLGLPDAVVNSIQEIIMYPVGLVVVAGDYFSHKSIILAALVDLANQKRECHISTIENPIEYLHRHKTAMVVQKEIGTDVPDFGTALRQIRFENPDVVMLSELWDALTAIELSQERLVLSSLKLGVRQNSVDNILKTLGDIVANNARRDNKTLIYAEKPKITVIYQQAEETIVHNNF